MKFQHVAIMFIIIFAPVMILTTYFINLQLKTIRTEAEYNQKLIDATYDAMSAFELNTANEDLSTVSDSLRSIIEASNNIFFNTLATNLGVSNASKSYVQPYVPAILYTLYDGYYIYAPTNIPIICTDRFGQTVTTADYGVKFQAANKYKYSPGAASDYNDYTRISGDKVTLAQAGDEYGQILYENKDGSYSTKINANTKYKKSYILKSYISYAANYKRDKKNITINYTLDNFMSIEGFIDNTYYAKSGYFIRDTLVDSVKVNNTAVEWTKYSEDEWDKMIYDPENYNIQVTIDNGKIKNGATEVDVEDTVISNRDGLIVPNSGEYSGIIKYWDDAQKAVDYYIKAWMFSKWVYSNLNDITVSDIQNKDYQIYNLKNNTTTADLTDDDHKTKLYSNMFYDFSADASKKPFAAAAANDPEDKDSIFWRHKEHMIQNSITYNITLSMIVYTEASKLTEFSMPILQQEEWQKILNNVSIVTFMQGMSCGLKYYNNYAIVTSTNNEISITENEIYYAPRVEVKSSGGEVYLSTIDDDTSLGETGQYETVHRLDCNNLKLLVDLPDGSKVDLGAISLKSKEIKYDKIYSKAEARYIYDHKAYTDYHCIVDSNYTVTGAITHETHDGNTNILEFLKRNVGDAETKAKLKAYRIAIAKERTNLYKPIAHYENYGYQEFVFNNSTTSANAALGSEPLGKVLTASSAGTTFTLYNMTNQNYKQIYKIDVVLSDSKLESSAGVRMLGVASMQLKCKFGSNPFGQTEIIAANSTEYDTKTFYFNMDSGTGNAITLQLSYNDTSGTTKYDHGEVKIRSIRVYYK